MPLKLTDQEKAVLDGKEGRVKQAAMDFRQEHLDHEEKMIHGGSGLENATDYEIWLEKIHAAVTWEYSEALVPASVYWGIDNHRIVGIIQIRHILNQFLRNTYGHIGYGVHPSERRKGYATEMLAQALVQCRELGIEKALLSCDTNNIGSAKTILKNGGIADKVFTEEDDELEKGYSDVVAGRLHNLNDVVAEMD